MPVYNRHTNQKYFDLFRTMLQTLSPESAKKYRQTLTQLDSFITGHRAQLSDWSDTMATDWTIEMLSNGLSRNTVTRHLNTMSSLLRSAAINGMIPPTDTARRLAKTLEDSKETLPQLMNSQTYSTILSILRKTAGKQDNHTIYEDMLLFSLLNGAMPFGEIASLKKEEITGFEGLSLIILNRNLNNRRNYIFDLQQSYRTTRQVHTAISEGIGRIFGNILSISGTDPDNLARSIWAACMIKSGATASEAAGCLNGTATYAIPSFCIPAKAASELRLQWIRTVNSLLMKETPRWYAMHLRKGVGFEEIRKAVSETIHPVPELFYPCETIKRLNRKKALTEERPYIAQTVFFQTNPDNVMPMFRLIGDKAWCYRITNTPGAPYAVIPRDEMKRFQSAIGLFTPDTDIHPLGTLKPEPGEKIIVIQAGYENREGTIEEIIGNDCGPTIFRIRLTTDYGYEWRMNIDARQVERTIQVKHEQSLG